MDEKPREGRHARRFRDHNVVMRFFSEMKMSDDDMLEKMQDRKTQQHIDGGRLSEGRYTGGDKLEKYERENKSSAQRQKRFLNATGPHLS